MEHDRFAAAIATSFEAAAGRYTNAYLTTRLAGERMHAQAAAALTGMVASSHAKFLDEIGQLAAPYDGAEPLLEQLAAISRRAAHQTLRQARGMDKKALFTTELSGGLRDLLRRAQTNIKFTAPDAAGRTWPAGKLVRFLARDFAYQYGIDRAAENLAMEGDLVQVSYLDATHVNHGMVVSLAGHPGHPSFESIRAAAFHPNSSAQLTHVRPK